MLDDGLWTCAGPVVHTISLLGMFARNIIINIHLCFLFVRYEFNSVPQSFSNRKAQIF